LRFEAKDGHFYPGQISQTKIWLTIDEANALLAERLAKCPEVTGYEPEWGDGKDFTFRTWGSAAKGDTHRARLVGIEPIAGEKR
jgi:hypothetical protein